MALASYAGVGRIAKVSVNWQGHRWRLRVRRLRDSRKKAPPPPPGVVTVAVAESVLPPSVALRTAATPTVAVLESVLAPSVLVSVASTVDGEPLWNSRRRLTPPPP
jgi:hypothetical protein